MSQVFGPVARKTETIDRFKLLYQCSKVNNIYEHLEGIVTVMQ